MLRPYMLLPCTALLTACAMLDRAPPPREPGGGAADAQQAEMPAIQVEEPEVASNDTRAGSPADPEMEPEATAEESESGESGTEESAASPASPAAMIDTSETSPDALDDAGETRRHALTGRIELVASGEIIGPGQFRDTVVYFEPDTDLAPPAPGRFEIRTERKRFKPDVLVVPVGSTVAFPNDDDILHNVFSVSPGAEFDLGRYGMGESRSHTFNDTGLALIHCDVHHAMQAEVLVVDTRYYTRLRNDGTFSLADIPAGPGKLHIWHPRAEALARNVRLPLDRRVEATLALVKPRVVRHENKLGEPYRASRQAASQSGDENREPVAASVEAPAADPGTPPAGNNEIEGRVVLDGDDEEPGPRQYRDIVVYYQPAAGAPRPDAQRYEIGTRNKTFSPDVLVVPVGSAVAFPNSDDILHNVFSVSPNAVFDLGRYGRGESRAHTFEEPGLALIHCDVHHHMQADVLVVDTPYFTRAGDDGSFRLAGLPDGPGVLHIWHPRADGAAERVELPLGERLAARLVITKPRVPKHLNKFGEPYRKQRPDDNN